MPPAENPVALSQALVLGLVQGPTELLPISSSAHTALISRLAGWDRGSPEPQARKSFELAVHGGAGLALALAARAELLAEARSLRPRSLLALALTVLPPALAGRALRPRIAAAPSGPRSIALSLIAGAVAMALADAGAQPDGRRCADASPVDGLAIGVAQALALTPGVSRSGAALTAARARGFGRASAQSLSRAAALPLLLGASAADVLGLAGGAGRPGAPAAHTGTPADGEYPSAGVRGPSAGAARAIGAAAAFASTWISVRLLLRGAWRERSLLPYAAYRVALAAAILLAPSRSRG
jgi:undecaprenyl-diphosphatase